MAEINKEKTVEQKYKRETLRESILNRPDTYVGSDKMAKEFHYIYDDKTNKIVKKEIEIVPALVKIFDEALVNAADQVTRTYSDSKIPADKRVTYIKVEIDREKGSIMIENDGPGIPVEMHKVEKMYVPELIFGELLTSSNYNKEEKKLTGGKNGVGIKLAAIFSTKFVVETIDAVNKKKFQMVIKDNLSVKKKPTIWDLAKDKTIKSKTAVKFFPDFKRFNMDGFTDDVFALLKRRAYDLSGCMASQYKIKVYFNDGNSKGKGEIIPIKKFDDYMKLYFDSSTSIVTEQFNERWEVGVTLSEETFEHVSFVNYINTYKGGKHVEYVANKIVSALMKVYEKKFKGRALKSSTVKNRLFVFVNSLIENPSFESQSKEELRTPPKDFGSSFEMDDKFIKKVRKLGIDDEVDAFVTMEEKKKAKKTDGKKTARVKIPKLDDAAKAGTKEAHKCSLILTEGDSAKGFAVSGLRVIGNDYYGVFPLKGKLINTRVQSRSKVSANEEIKKLKEILGLEQGKVYTDVSSLRYGKVIILTDQDVDGSHIKGLLINWLENDWPSLLKLNFIQSLITPIVKVFKPSGKEAKSFYTLQDYEKWQKGPNNGFTKVKYYKGLGTSNTDEQVEAFENLDNKLLQYIYDKNASLKVCQAFDKGLADTRKKWLLNYDKNDILDIKDQNVDISDFVTKDLIHFSYYDVLRSIPSMIDGFKPSQRKIIYAALKRHKGDKDEIKVGQLSGYVSSNTDYHHGEASLVGAIIKIAQNFVGTNNINLLNPNGQFGTRRKGGDDAASERYIFTSVKNITKSIFNTEDNKILNYQYSDNMQIEPEYYMPCIPTLLVNGAKGIGTGFSTEVLQYNPLEIIQVLRDLMDGKDVKVLQPYYRGWNGDIETTEKKEVDDEGEEFLKYTYSFNGKFTFDDKKKMVYITELPLFVWTDTYKEFLEDLVSTKKDKGFGIKDFKLLPANEIIEIKVFFDDKNYKLVKKDPLKYLKLSKKVTAGNMYLFNEDNIITKYNSVADIIRSFYKLRLDFYKQRKANIIAEKEKKATELRMKYLFVKAIIEGKLHVTKKSRTEIEKDLEKMKFVKIDNSFNYLTNMSIYNLTTDNAEKLKNEYEKAERELEVVKKTTVKTMWKRDLDAIEKLVEEENKRFFADLEKEKTEMRKKNKSFFK